MENIISPWIKRIREVLVEKEAISTQIWILLLPETNKTASSSILGLILEQIRNAGWAVRWKQAYIMLWLRLIGGHSLMNAVFRFMGQIRPNSRFCKKVNCLLILLEMFYYHSVSRMILRNILLATRAMMTSNIKHTIIRVVSVIYISRTIPSRFL